MKNNCFTYCAKGTKSIGTDLLGNPIMPIYIGSSSLEEAARFGQGLNRHNVLIDNLVKTHGYDLKNDFVFSVIKKDLTPEEAAQVETQSIMSAILQNASLNVVKVSYFDKQIRSSSANKVLRISSYSGNKAGTKFVATVRRDGETESVVCSRGFTDLFKYCNEFGIPVPSGKELVKLQRKANRMNWVFVSKGVAVNIDGERVESTTTETVNK